MLNLESIRDYCLAKNGVSEEMPFGDSTLVFKVNGKIFLLLPLGETDRLSFNVKCDPEKAIDLRERYSAVLPGFHMNKKHWNTVVLDGSISDATTLEFIDHSYNLVLAGMSKKKR